MTHVLVWRLLSLSVFPLAVSQHPYLLSSIIARLCFDTLCLSHSFSFSPPPLFLPASFKFELKKRSVAFLSLSYFPLFLLLISQLFFCCSHIPSSCVSQPCTHFLLYSFRTKPVLLSLSNRASYDLPQSSTPVTGLEVDAMKRYNSPQCFDSFEVMRINLNESFWDLISFRLHILKHLLFNSFL